MIWCLWVLVLSLELLVETVLSSTLACKGIISWEKAVICHTVAGIVYFTTMYIILTISVASLK